ncbi:DUF3168 domain-containing protein [Arenibacterium sp. CAU 1754]
MSYAMSSALQAAVYQHLQNDAGVTALVGGAVYDAVPAGDKPDIYVSLGPEDVRDRSDVTGQGALHRFLVSVVTDAAGFTGAKAVAAAISDAMVDADLTLSRGRLVGLWFERATARRGGKAGRIRRIDLRFRARVEDN